MWIIGSDYHPRFQQIAMVNTEGGECGQRRLEHVEQDEQFYRSLQGEAVRVGMEASGHGRWFERLLAKLERCSDPLDQAVEQEAARRLEVVRLRTHPGVGPITGLAFVLTIGDPRRFQCGKQAASYLGLIPAEDSSGGRQRLGHISKQGNALAQFAGGGGTQCGAMPSWDDATVGWR